MKYTLTLQTEDPEELEIYLEAPQYLYLIEDLYSEARKLWKYSENPKEQAIGEWCRDTLLRLARQSGKLAPALCAESY